MNWIKPNDFWDDDELCACPVLGDPEDFCWFRFDPKNDDETIHDVLLAQAVSKHDDLIIGATSIHHESEDEMLTWHLYEVRCAKTNDPYYLITQGAEPWYCEEDTWFCIPAFRFNIKMFKEHYLGPSYSEMDC